MQYSLTEHITEHDWRDFILNHPLGNIFQTPEIYKVYTKTKNYKPILLGVSSEKKSIVGVLLAVIQAEHSGFLGKLSKRSIIIGGPIVKDNDPDILDLLLKAYQKIIKGKAIYTQVRNLFDQKSLQNYYELNGFKYEAHLDILINLDVSKGELLKGIKREKSRNLTKSLNKGIAFKEIQTRDELQEGYKLLYSTYRRLKLPLPDYSLFINAFNILQYSGYIKIFGAYSKARIIGVRLVLNYKDKIYDWFAGSDENSRNQYPNDFLIINTLMWGIKNKYTEFDFGGAGKPEVPYGVRDHKIKFGGKLVEFGRFEKVHNPILMKLGILGFHIYKILKF